MFTMYVKKNMTLEKYGTKKHTKKSPSKQPVSSTLFRKKHFCNLYILLKYFFNHHIILW